jgi:hypothetical protein
MRIAFCGCVEPKPIHPLGSSDLHVERRRPHEPPQIYIQSKCCFARAIHSKCCLTRAAFSVWCRHLRTIPTSITRYLYVGLDDHWQNCTTICPNGTVIPSWKPYNGDYDYQCCRDADGKCITKGAKTLPWQVSPPFLLSSPPCALQSEEMDIALLALQRKDVDVA